MGIDHEKVKNWSILPVTAKHTRKDTINFARGVVAGMPSPLQKEDQQFLRDDARLKVCQ